MEQLHDVLARVGEWASDDQISRGLAVAGGAALGVLLAGWRWLRRRPDPERVKVNVDAPKGQCVRVELRDRDGL